MTNILFGIVVYARALRRIVWAIGLELSLCRRCRGRRPRGGRRWGQIWGKWGGELAEDLERKILETRVERRAMGTGKDL
jgi:hypothetical protein